MDIDRRRHRLFVTHHTEYHLRADEVVGVRDRETGTWMRDHAALRLRAINLPPRGHDHSWLGRRLQFFGMGTDVVTSPVVAVGRPDRDVVDHYISQARAGTIVAKA
jgi:hypothetical protein